MDSYIADPAGRAHVLNILRVKLGAQYSEEAWEQLSDREKMQWLKEKVKSEIRSIWCAHNISLKRKLMAIYLSF